jgi:iron complex outermembrane receptor protein
LGANAQSTIVGFVKDTSTNIFIKDAQVTLLEKDQVVYTDENGRFEFKTNSNDAVTIRIVALGFESLLQKIHSTENNQTFWMRPQHLDLQEVTVSGLTIQSRNQNIFHIETRKVSALNAIPTIGMGELIAKIPGVYQASLGLGIAKPVIRGLQGMRIVSLMNGMRIESQQWGGDHGMGMAELGIGSVEVIKGPASLLYGADALGGVIQFNDLTPAAVNTIEGQVQLLAQTNTMGGVTRFTLRQSGTKWRYMLAGSLANHADFQLSNGKFAQNSRFNEEVIRGVLSYTSKRGLHHLRYTYNQTVSGIPGHTHDSLVNYLDFQVEKQKRKYTLPAQFFNNHFISFDNKWFLKKGEFFALLSYTNNGLIEYDEKVTIPSLSMTLQNSSYNLRYTYQAEKWKWISGVMGMYQLNTNASNASDQLIPNASTLDNGIYSTLMRAGDKINFQVGLRYDIRQLNVLEDSLNQSFSYQGLNGALGLVYHGKSVTLRSALSTGFRAPHLTELFSNGFHHGALRYEIGDVRLKPEKATQLDLTVEWQKEHFSLLFNPYVNYIRDFISLLPQDSLVEGIPVFTYNRIAEVYYFGADLGVHLHPHFLHNLHLESSLSYIDTYALQDSAIAMLPQPRIQTQLRYEFDRKNKICLKEIFLQHAWLGDQSKVAFYELPSKQYHLLDVGLNFSFGKKSIFEASIGCKNILNERYIDHLSRLKNIQLPGPGRNFYINLKYIFTAKIKSHEQQKSL